MSTELSRPFRVVTHRNWVYDFFQDLGAVHDYGFDIDPSTAPDTLWWASGQWVARAAKAGVRLPLTACGPEWLAGLPESYTGRRIEVVRVEGLESVATVGVSPVHVKLPEVKTDRFEAQVLAREDLLAAVRDAELPASTLLQVSETVEFASEARFFVADGRVTTGALYRNGSEWWGEAGMYRDRELLNDLKAFADEVVSVVPGAPGYSLDVGVTEGGECLVVEANAAWSSGVYDCDPDGVMEALIASHDFGDEHPRCSWRGDAVFGEVRPLRVTLPVTG
jgi:hypothetical protein